MTMRNKPSVIEVEYNDKHKVIYKDVTKLSTIWHVYHTILALLLAMIVVIEAIELVKQW